VPPGNHSSGGTIDAVAGRPELDEAMTEHEFRRWYYTMAEVQPFARRLGVSAAGPKADLVERLGARLAGRVHSSSPRRAAAPAATRRAASAQLEGPLTLETLIPVGQRSTQALREFFTEYVGPGFRFNGHMRAFLLAGEATLGDAITHWHQTVGTELPPQSASLEFNRFTKAWHAAQPTRPPAECRRAWAAHRALPSDERPA